VPALSPRARNKKTILDEKCFKIFSELSRDGRVGVRCLGRRLGLSHPVVSERLRSLLGSGFLRVLPCFNLGKLGLRLVAIFVDVGSREDLTLLVEKLRSCRWVVLLFTLAGEYNLLVVLAVKDLSFVECLVGKRIRGMPGVKKLSIGLVGEPVSPGFIPLSQGFFDGEEPVCGESCDQCSDYLERRCPGCTPLTPNTTNVINHD